MLQQRIIVAFAGDPDAQRAVIAVGQRVANYAELTRRLAVAQFASDVARDTMRKHAIELRDIIESRARSGGVVDHEMEAFWDAALANASHVANRRLVIHPIPPRHVAPAPGAAAPLVPPAKIARARKLRNHRA